MSFNNLFFIILIKRKVDRQQRFGIALSDSQKKLARAERYRPIFCFGNVVLVLFVCCFFFNTTVYHNVFTNGIYMYGKLNSKPYFTDRYPWSVN